MNPISESFIEIRDFDLIRSCRLCLSKNLNMSHIFNDDKNIIIDKIEFCTGIQVKEVKGLPTQICQKCLTNLSVAHKFKVACLLSERSLEKILLGRVKVEIPDNESDINNEEAGSNGEIDYYYTEIDVKVEDGDQCKDSIKSLKQLKCDESDLRSSKQQKLNVKNHCKIKEKKPKATIKRGPYKKGAPRLKKFKFKRLCCDICNIKFTSKQESDDHRRALHAEDISWICEVCGARFAHRSSLYTHVRSHRAPHYGCAHCDYSTTNKSDLVKHLRVHFGIKKYKCTTCGALHSNSSNLREHERRHHQTVVKRFACNICERLFYDRTKLNRHLDAHNDIKRFKCDICCSCFSRRCKWKQHMEKQHHVVVPPQRPGPRKTNLLIIGDVKTE